MFVLQKLSIYLFSRKDSFIDYNDDFTKYRKRVKLNNIVIGFHYMCLHGLCENDLYIALHINHRIYRYCIHPGLECVSYEVGYNVTDRNDKWFYKIIYRPKGWQQGSHIEFKKKLKKNIYRKFVFQCLKNITLPVVSSLCPYTQGTMLELYNTKYKNYSKQYKPVIYDIDALLYEGVIQTI